MFVDILVFHSTIVAELELTCQYPSDAYAREKIDSMRAFGAEVIIESSIEAWLPRIFGLECVSVQLTSFPLVIIIGSINLIIHMLQAVIRNWERSWSLSYQRLMRSAAW